MSAHALLGEAVRDGGLVRSTQVDATQFPHSARTYLSDGSGLAWTVPAPLRSRGTFVVDAEIPAVMRPSLVRRFGPMEPVDFARQWTRAEALAKLADVPIITWLSWCGLTVPDVMTAARDGNELAWKTIHHQDAVVTFAVATCDLTKAVSAAR